jgi:hypothetical protein
MMPPRPECKLTADSRILVVREHCERVEEAGMTFWHDAPLNTAEYFRQYVVTASFAKA